MIKGTFTKCTEKELGKAIEMYSMTIAVARADSGVGVQISSTTTETLASLANGYRDNSPDLTLPPKLLADIQELESNFANDFMNLVINSAENECKKPKGEDYATLKKALLELQQGIDDMVPVDSLIDLVGVISKEARELHKKGSL